VSRTAFWIALSFLTRLPVRRGLRPTPQALGASLVFYPAVGLLLGGLLAFAALLLAGHALVGAALLLALWVGLTGALHLDGVADLADLCMSGVGMRAMGDDGAASGPERCFALLKDPHVGTGAVVAVALVVLVKYAAIAELMAAGRAGPALLLAPMVARAGAGLLLLGTPTAKPDGLAAALMAQAPRRAVGATAVCALLLAVLAAALVSGVGSAPAWSPLAMGCAGVAVVLAPLLVAWWIRSLAMGLVGGLSGDFLGAAVELMETAVLLVFVCA
jgi:adenosylcobinamide-GDP ribazoletransferase